MRTCACVPSGRLVDLFPFLWFGAPFSAFCVVLRLTSAAGASRCVLSKAASRAPDPSERRIAFASRAVLNAIAATTFVFVLIQEDYIRPNATITPPLLQTASALATGVVIVRSYRHGVGICWHQIRQRRHSA